jgi:hypothetical protein
VTGQTARTVLETANAMYGERGFSFSHPVFRTRKYLPHYTPADPLFQWQYNYNNTRKYFNGSDSIPGKDIDACKAWEITKGSPDIKIAVIDEGITNHVDFPSGALIDTIDVTGAKHYDPKMDSNCAPWWQAAHGFAVSGLIIGQHNDKGIAGLVPNCKLIFIKIADDTARWPQRE